MQADQLQVRMALDPLDHLGTDVAGCHLEHPDLAVLNRAHAVLRSRRYVGLRDPLPRWETTVQTHVRQRAIRFTCHFYNGCEEDDVLFEPVGPASSHAEPDLRTARYLGATDFR